MARNDRDRDHPLPPPQLEIDRRNDGSNHLLRELIAAVQVSTAVLQRIERTLGENHKALIEIERRSLKAMATLDDLVAAATAEDTKIDSLIALVQALKAKVDAIPGLTPAQQAQIDAAFASISDNPDRIQAAIDANTPAEPE